ncbi:MAG: B12-binding domain-containing radical SAM protein, partial [Desulfobacterales bacterium]
MNTLLIYPAFPDTFWSFKHALKFIHKRSAFPPLGLLTVGAMLPPNWPKRLIDINVNKLTEKDLTWADSVFISAMAVQRESARQIISRCQKAGLKVVAGGPLFTDEHAAFGEVDHFILNEAELTLPPFLQDLEQGCAQKLYETSEFADLKETPPPIWGLIDLRRYAAMSIQFSRGCPFNCDFCNITALLGHRVRTKTAAQIIGELDSLYQLGWRGQIFFVDDNFIGNKKYLLAELLPALIEWQKDKKHIRFNTESSVNLADNEMLMEMMVAAGFDSVFIGIETPAEAGLAECNKKQNKNRDLVESVKRIQRAGLQVQGGFIVGFDSDTPSIFQRQIDFIQKSGIVTAMVGLLNAPPGTRLYNRLKQEGRLTGLISCNTDGTTNIIPRMDLKALKDGYKKIMGQIYSPKSYYERVRIFLKEYKAPRSNIPLDFQRFLAFFRSSIRLGIFGKERFH